MANENDLNAGASKRLIDNRADKLEEGQNELHPAGLLGEEGARALCRPAGKTELVRQRDVRTGDVSPTTAPTKAVDMNPAYEYWRKAYRKPMDYQEPAHTDHMIDGLRRVNSEGIRMELGLTAAERMKGMKVNPVDFEIERDSHGLRKFTAEGVIYERIGDKWTTRTAHDAAAKTTTINANIYERIPGEGFSAVTSIIQSGTRGLFDKQEELHVINKDTGEHQIFYRDGRVLEQNPNESEEHPCNIERVGNQPLSFKNNYGYGKSFHYRDGKLDSVEHNGDDRWMGIQTKMENTSNGKPRYEYDLSEKKWIFRDSDGTESRHRLLPKASPEIKRYDDWGNPAEIQYNDGSFFRVDSWDAVGRPAGVSFQVGEHSAEKRYNYDPRRNLWCTPDGKETVEKISRVRSDCIFIEDQSGLTELNSDGAIHSRRMHGGRWGYPYKVGESDNWEPKITRPQMQLDSAAEGNNKTEGYEIHESDLRKREDWLRRNVEYDQHNRASKITYEDGSTTRVFSRDERGEPTRVRLPNGDMCQREGSGPWWSADGQPGVYRDLWIDNAEGTLSIQYSNGRSASYTGAGGVWTDLYNFTSLEPCKKLFIMPDGTFRSGPQSGADSFQFTDDGSCVELSEQGGMNHVKSIWKGGRRIDFENRAGEITQMRVFDNKGNEEVFTKESTFWRKDRWKHTKNGAPQPDLALSVESRPVLIGQGVYKECIEMNSKSVFDYFFPSEMPALSSAKAMQIEDHKAQKQNAAKQLLDSKLSNNGEPSAEQTTQPLAGLPATGNAGDTWERQELPTLDGLLAKEQLLNGALPKDHHISAGIAELVRQMDETQAKGNLSAIEQQQVELLKEAVITLGEPISQFEKTVQEVLGSLRKSRSPLIGFAITAGLLSELYKKAINQSSDDDSPQAKF